jgi:hypothetical protein
MRRIADNTKQNSWATRLRRKRFALFQSLLATVPRPLTILDVGGSQGFWETMGFSGLEGVSVVLLNVSHTGVTLPGFESVVGDARDMTGFVDGQFDVVISNSVIEHVGDYGDQSRMAREVRRVGRRYFVQTPNRHFPIEPHFLFPCFQYLPVRVRVFLVRHFQLGWYGRGVRDERAAREVVNSIRLLSGREFMRLFPGGSPYREKVWGLTKSLVAYGGWERPQHSNKSDLGD